MSTSASFAHRFWQGVSKAPDWSAVVDLSPVSPAQQKHLQKVFLSEVAFLLLYGLGARLNMGFPFGGVTTFLSLWGLFLPFLLLPITPRTQPLRLGLGVAMCLLKGASAGPLVRTLASVQDFSPVAAAVAASSAVFLAFTVAALLCQGRRQVLLLGGFCGSALSVPLALHLGSLAFGADVMRFSVQTSIGLMVLAVLTVYGTQVMIDRAASSQMDFVADSFEFWIDILAVSFHLLVGGKKKLTGEAEEASKKTT